MAARVVLASRRFQREYPEFVRKYSELDGNFRKFLQFRFAHRPDEPFGAKDCRLSKSKLRRCHLVHGKAILIYQLHGSEIRLITLQEHEVIEGGSRSALEARNYARSLGTQDYYLFDVDKAISEKPDKMTEETTLELATEIEAPQAESHMVSPEQAHVMPLAEQDKPEEAPAPGPAPAAPAADEPINGNTQWWADKRVEYLRGQGLLYVPRPARPVMLIQVTKELIVPEGDFVGFDLAATPPEVFHLTQSDVDARYQRDKAHQHVTDIADAVPVIMPRRAPTAQSRPATRPEPLEAVPQAAIQQPASKPPAARISTRKHDISPQLGRILLALKDLQDQGVLVDSATLKNHIHIRDSKSMSAVLWVAQKDGLVAKTPKDGGGTFTYRLTALGKQKSKMLGVWPFTVANLPVPSYLEDSDIPARRH